METSFTSATILLLLGNVPLGNVPILLPFMFFGNRFMNALGLSDVSLQVGGGVILFLIALKMVFPVAEGIFGSASAEQPFIVQPP